MATKSPATNCTITQKAICAASIVFIRRRCPCGFSPPRRAIAGFTPDARRAGASPKSRVTTNARLTLNASSRQPVTRISRTGSSGTRSMDTTIGADHQANNSPRAEAAAASMALSTSTSWISRHCPAPMETRRAISRERAAAWAVIRLPTLRRRPGDQRDQQAQDPQGTAIALLDIRRTRTPQERAGSFHSGKRRSPASACREWNVLQALLVIVGEERLHRLPHLLR